MELEPNRFKAAMAAGVPTYGLWLGLPDNSVAEIAATAGFDWLLVDHEHGPFELRDVLAHLQAIAAYPVAPLVRPASHDPALLKKLLDIGVQTLLVPMVDTAEQAADLVAAVRYPPAGRRGLGTSMARAARWNRVSGYAGKANAEICLIVQAETATAMANLDAILRVDGVDGIFIGPSDLSASMGHLGNTDHPDVEQAIETGLRTIRSAGKYAGLLCLDPGKVAAYVKQGANFVGVGVDSLVLSQGLQEVAERFKGGGAGGSPAPCAGY